MAARDETLRITRLRVENWRNFRSAEVHLANRAFFVGPNASGKSNILDAIRFLRDLAREENYGLATAVANRGGISKLRSLHAKRTGDIVIDVDVGNEDDRKKWNYILRFNSFEKGRSLVKEERISGQNGDVIKRQDFTGKAPDQFTQTLIEQAREREAFKELADFFRSIRYLHVVPQIIRDPSRQIEKGDDPFGGDLMRRISETKEKTRNARLKRIGEALKNAVPEFLDLRFNKDETGKPHLEAGFKHWRKDLSYQNEQFFSDGTLRLIGFLWSIAEKGGPLLLEEPELSLNEDIVRNLSAMIYRMQSRSGRQVIMTTHSDALLSDEGIGPYEIHRLEPGPDGTSIHTAGDDKNILAQVEAGFSVGKIILPLTNPRGASQLSFFDVVS